MAGSDKLIVAAIDFGTTYSGVAFSYQHAFKQDPRNVSVRHWTADHGITLKDGDYTTVSPDATCLHVDPASTQTEHYSRKCCLKISEGPTSVLIPCDGTEVDCFGYEAEIRYSELVDEEEQEGWYFFRRFKMMLHGDTAIQSDTLLEDVSGKKMAALKVFSLSIRYLKDYPWKKAGDQLLDAVSEDDIHWVLTVPAIWNDTAKQFMRKAAEMAGIDGKNLTIALEPETASLYCRHIPVEKSMEAAKSSLSQFKSGTKYIVLDAGGGTVDVTVHLVTFEGDIKELHHATGGAWGGTKVDEAFEGFLKTLLTDNPVDEFKRDFFGDNIDLSLDFEMKKRNLSSKSAFVNIKIPASLVKILEKTPRKNLETAIASSPYSGRIKVVSDKLKIDVDIIKGLFLPTVNTIVGHVKDLLRLPSVRGCSTIVMVGGFSECQLLQEKVREAFPSMKVIIPEDAWIAVLKGAVIFGHNPTAIAERVCKYTYGTAARHVKSESCNHPPGKTRIDENGDELCADIFDIHVRKGQSVKLGEKQQELISIPGHDNHTIVSQEIYASTEEHPNFVTDKGCQKIGKFAVPITGGRKGKIGTTFMFGGTEIEVIVEDKLTREVTRRRVDFLG